jgi:ketosteroid isomerase-like protein
MNRMLLIALIGVCVPRVSHSQEAVKKELVDLEHTINEATRTKDRAALERIYADEYYCVHSNGAAMDKAAELAKNMSTENAWTDFDLDDVVVRVFGDVGILTGRLSLKGSAKGFQPGARRFTDIFVRRAGRWQLINCQTTLVPG